MSIQQAINLSIAEELMVFWMNAFAVLQMEGSTGQDIALDNYRMWNTVFTTLSDSENK